MKTAIIGCILALGLSAAAQSAQNPTAVFQLGVFDGASNEFAEGAPVSLVVTDAGSADFAHQWYAGQEAARASVPSLRTCINGKFGMFYLDSPLESEVVTSQDKAVAPRPLVASQQASYLEVGDPAVLVEDWKPAEDGNGTILRLLDLGGPERQVTVKTSLIAISRAVQTDAVERDQHDLPLAGQHELRVAVHPHQIVTIRIIGKTVTANRASQEVH